MSDASRSSIIDEAVASGTAALVAPTRRTSPDEAAKLRADVAADLPALDAAARSWTGLGGELEPTRVRVVSRVGWVRANLAGLRGALEPVADRAGGRPLASQALGLQLGL
ncbi:MAG: zinc-dependent metalloprotease, partial [Nitriliruptorales bacterium]